MFQNPTHLTKTTTINWQWKRKGAGSDVKSLPAAYNGISNIKQIKVTFQSLNSNLSFSVCLCIPSLVYYTKISCSKNQFQDIKDIICDIHVYIT